MLILISEYFEGGKESPSASAMLEYEFNIIMITSVNYNNKKEGQNDNDYCKIWQIGDYDSPIKEIRIHNKDIYTPKPSFLEGNKIIYLSFDNELIIYDFISNVYCSVCGLWMGSVDSEKFWYGWQLCIIG